MSCLLKAENINNDQDQMSNDKKQHNFSFPERTSHSACSPHLLNDENTMHSSFNTEYSEPGKYATNHLNMW